MVCFPFLKVICLLGRQMVAYPSITEMCSWVEAVEMKGKKIYMEYIWGVGLLMNFMKENFFKKGIKDGLKEFILDKCASFFKSHLLINLDKINPSILFKGEF